MGMQTRSGKKKPKVPTPKETKQAPEALVGRIGAIFARRSDLGVRLGVGLDLRPRDDVVLLGRGEGLLGLFAVEHADLVLDGDLGQGLLRRRGGGAHGHAGAQTTQELTIVGKNLKECASPPSIPQYFNNESKVGS